MICEKMSRGLKVFLSFCCVLLFCREAVRRLLLLPLLRSGTGLALRLCVLALLPAIVVFVLIVSEELSNKGIISEKPRQSSSFDHACDQSGRLNARTGVYSPTYVCPRVRAGGQACWHFKHRSHAHLDISILLQH